MQFDYLLIVAPVGVNSHHLDLKSPALLSTHLYTLFQTDQGPKLPEFKYIRFPFTYSSVRKKFLPFHIWLHQN